jgi:hypothetical protein
MNEPLDRSRRRLACDLIDERRHLVRTQQQVKFTRVQRRRVVLKYAVRSISTSRRSKRTSLPIATTTGRMLRAQMRTLFPGKKSRQAQRTKGKI